MADSEVVENVEEVALERRIPPEFYIHLVFFLMAVAVIAMSILMKVEGVSFVFLPGAKSPMPESCTARIFFGVDCPACGLTRAFISISHGRWINAWRFNPSSFVVYLFVAVQIPWQLNQIRLILQRKRAIDGFWIYVLPLVMAAAMIIQWLTRLIF